MYVRQAVNMWRWRQVWLSRLFEKLIFQYKSVTGAVRT